MKKHFVYFYGSTKIISGPNSLTADNIRLRNQIIGFEGIDSGLAEDFLIQKNIFKC